MGSGLRGKVMPKRELDINVTEYSCCGGEYSEMIGQTPGLVVECIEYLLTKFQDDAQATKLLERLRQG
jgi:hypothetical protein